MLRSDVGSSFATVSGQPTGSIFKGQAFLMNKTTNWVTLNK